MNAVSSPPPPLGGDRGGLRGRVPFFERRGWDEKRYQRKNAEEDKNNHYNFSRKHLNFEIMKGGQIVPLGSDPVPLHKRLQKRHDQLGFKPYMDADHPGQVAENTPNCLVNILFGGDRDYILFTEKDYI